MHASTKQPTQGTTMTHTIVSYTVNPGREQENAALVRAVFEELAKAQPTGMRYAVFQRPTRGSSFTCTPIRAPHLARCRRCLRFGRSWTGPRIVTSKRRRSQSSNWSALTARSTTLTAYRPQAGSPRRRPARRARRGVL